MSGNREFILKLQDDVDRLFDGRFQLHELVKRRPGSNILLATDQSTNGQVILKVVSGVSRGMRMRLDYETSTLRKIESMWLPALMDVAIDDETVYWLTEYVDGTPLSERLRDGRLSTREALSLAQCLFGAISNLHSHGVRHRNVRPANLVLIAGTDLSKLVDFGLTRDWTSESLLDGEAINNAWYLSPEQAGSIDQDVGVAADLYSAGAVLFAALAGRPPFCGDDVGEILLAHMTVPVPKLRETGVEVPRALDELLQRLLRKDPRDRYQLAEAVLEDLLQISESIEAGDTDPRVVIGSRDARDSLTEPAFVGREPELQEIGRRIDETRGGKAGVVFLEGESGAGKTRLLTEFAQHASIAGFKVFRGQGSNEVGQSALSLLDGVVDGFVSAIRSDDDLTARLVNDLAGDCAAIISALPKLSGVLNDSTVAIDGPEDFVEARGLRALESFINALGSPEKPAMVILDDCQWADELTFKLLKRLQQEREVAERDHYVLVLVAFRSEEVSTSHALRDITPTTHFQLPTLEPEAVKLLVESMAGPLPKQALDFITRVAAGSPFMASAALRGLVESGALIAGEVGWRIDPLAMAECQSSDRAASFLTRRLELLAPPAIDLLSAAAVLGREFNLDAAGHLAGQSTTHTIASLDDARRRHLVWVRPDELRCVFVHDKIREALLAHLQESQRRTIHLRAAEYLSTQDAARAVDLAFHFDAAGDATRALPYAVEAAEQARSQHSLGIAKEQYLIARRSADSADRDTQYRIAEGLGDVLMLRGEYDAAAKLFEVGARLARGRVARAQIRGKLAELARKRGDMERAIRDYEEALRTLGVCVPRRTSVFLLLLLWETAVQILHTVLPTVFLRRLKREPDDAERQIIRLFSGLVHAYYYGRGKAPVMWAHLRGLNLGERYLPTLELANAYSEHAPIIALVTLFRRAFRYARKSHEIRKSFGDLWGQGQSLHYHGCALYAASRFEECISKCREAVRLLERMGDYWQVHIARYQIAASLYHLGDFRAAVEESKKNHASGLELGDEQASGIILDVWARATAGRVPKEILDTEVVRTRFDAQGTSQVLLAKGVCLLAEGNEDEAIDVLKNAIDVAQCAGVFNAYSLPAMAWYVSALRQKAQTFSVMAQAQRRRALRKAATAARRAKRASWICMNDLPHVLREAALISAMRERQRPAMKLFDQSLEVAKELGSKLEFAQTLLVKGQVGRELAWPNADKQIAQAESIISTLTIASGFIEKDDSTGAGAATLSLADRFDTVLESGRRITSAITETDVYTQSRTAALRLLRGERCVVAQIDEVGNVTSVDGDLDLAIDVRIIEQAVTSRRAVALVVEVDEIGSDRNNLERSVICVPIIARGKARACVYVTHDHVRGLFGKVEQRLAEFIATIAGAACENAEGFSQLQALNETLEERVQERTAAAEARASELTQSNRNLECVANELRQTEEQLRVAIKEAESANEAKSQFLAAMSHEIRSPMNGILGMTELVMNTSLTRRQQGCLNVVKHSGEALMTLLNDILDFSKIEAGRMELEEIMFNLREVVENSVRLLSTAAHKKQLELVCRVATDTPHQVFGDPNRLRQIIDNLLGNAIKFTDSGEVLVDVWPERKEGVDVVRFAVADTGIGIPLDRQQMVFEAFRQSDSSMTRKFGGTGLGLSISNTLVELMQGSIWLESEPGQGSTFHFAVPLEQAAPSANDQTDNPLRDVPVLLVSQFASGRRAYGELLESFGCQLTIANDLADVTSTAWSAQALVIIDQPTGVHADAEAQTCKYPCPVVLLACLNDATDIDLPCVIKPVVRVELWETVLQALNKQPPTNDPNDEARHTDHWIELRILVADDSRVNQEVAAGLLQLRGHHVHIANNGLEVLESLSAEQFDVVLMDLQMPEMDGFEATATIRSRKEDEGASIPIIAMTAHAVRDTQPRCLAAGMDGYISKPIDPDELFSAIAAVLHQPTPFS